MNSIMHIDDKGKDVLMLGDGPTQGLDGTTLDVTETNYSINFTQSNRKFCLSLHYNGSNSLFVNAKNIYQVKTRDSEIKKYPLCLGNISNYFTAINI